MVSPTDVVIVDGIRTPFAKAGTALQDVHPVALGQTALKALLQRTELDVAEIDEVIIGNAGNPSDAANIARVIALRAGLPESISAYTVHRNCASALEAITSAYDRIKSGTLDVVVAGGTESMSQMPLLFSQDFQTVFAELAMAKTMAQRWQAIKKFRPASLKPRVAVMEGLTDPFSGINMGQTAEVLAKEFAISREQQDEYAARSHNRAVAAQQDGRLAEEITPVFVPPAFRQLVEQDVGPREGQTVAKLAKLKPYFDRRYGTVTVGNACPITDGAAMLLVMRRDKAESLGYRPLARIAGYGYRGLQPQRMGLGPVFASPVALQRAGIDMQQIGLVELNEAFAAQVLACTTAFASDQFARDELGLSKAIGEIDPERLNVQGGAIALGHPVGATGSRLVLTLMQQMRRQDHQFGLATLCIGGGQGGAVVLEKEA